MRSRGVVTNLVPCQYYFSRVEQRHISPINVTDIKDLTVDARNLGPCPLPFDIDGRPAKVGAHGEVGDTGSCVDCSSDVKEDTVRTRLHCRCSHHAQSNKAHDSTDGKVEIRSTNGDGNIDMLVVLGVWIHLNGIVSFLQPTHDRRNG